MPGCLNMTALLRISVFRKAEVCDVMWATTEKIREMMASGEFLSEWSYPYFDDMVKRYKKTS